MRCCNSWALPSSTRRRVRWDGERERGPGGEHERVEATEEPTVTNTCSLDGAVEGRPAKGQVDAVCSANAS
eukprot:8631688-Prorocentrum_lima.AAC.1